MGELRFGYVRGSRNGYPVPIGASEVFKTKSCNFVTNDGSGRAEVAGAASTDLMGAVESGDLTASSTEGGTELYCINNPNAVFKAPIAYDNSSYTQNYASSLLNTFVDIVVNTNLQYVDLSVSTRDHLKVVGGKAATNTATLPAFNNGYVLVQMNPALLDD